MKYLSYSLALAAIIWTALAGGILRADASGPVISGIADLTSYTNDASGKAVGFAPTAADSADGTVPVACNPSSGSIFAPGTTTVNCAASNSSFATTTASFSVRVILDTIPPVITPPATQIFATSTFPAAPFLTNAAATDETDPNPKITYSPHTFAAGTTTVTWQATDSAGNLATTTSLVKITEAVSVAIRDGQTLLGPFAVSLPDDGASPVALAATGSSDKHDIPAKSALAIFSVLDATSTEFEITDLQYFSSFGSFLVNCISIPAATSSPECANWLYAVNGAFPAVGADQYLLKNADKLYFFFNSSVWQLSSDKTSVSPGESFAVTTLKYDPATDTYPPAAGEIIGAVQTDANFNVTEFATSTANARGQVNLSVAPPGKYQIGVQSSGYFPAIELEVKTPPAPAASGGGGWGAIIHQNIDVAKAVGYLSSRQKTDGSFGAALYTDWAAIGLAAAPESASRDEVRSYLKSAPDTSSGITDYERHAMALLALGLNPYSATPTDYISKIAASFNGEQVGSPALVNDDIFAVFPLLKSGFAPDDPMIQKIAAFILSKQSPDGSWEENQDLTAAAVQALALVPSLPGASPAEAKARDYLKSRQEESGGFGDSSFSTSWVMQAVSALGEDSSNWLKNNHNPADYLFSFQQADGGLEAMSADENTRLWATAYALPAALQKPWASILSSFPRPQNVLAKAAASSGGIEESLKLQSATSSEKLAILPEEKIATAAVKILETATTSAKEASSSPLLEGNQTADTEDAGEGLESAENNPASPVIVKAPRTSPAPPPSLPPSGKPTISLKPKLSVLAAVGASLDGLIKNIDAVVAHTLFSFFSRVISAIWR